MLTLDEWRVEQGLLTYHLATNIEQLKNTVLNLAQSFDSCDYVLHC